MYVNVYENAVDKTICISTQHRESVIWRPRVIVRPQRSADVFPSLPEARFETQGTQKIGPTVRPHSGTNSVGDGKNQPDNGESLKERGRETKSSKELQIRHEDQTLDILR